ncbi:hypothetical protein P2318_04185 [Myxococcaceae bacterium GXIMD 01537]
MSSISKTFKKATKKIKKTAKKAGDAVSDTAKDAANKTSNAVTGAANAVAHEVSREAQELTKEMDKLARDASKVAEQAYGEALAAGEAAWNEVVELSERFLTDALVEIAEALAEDIYRKHLKLIELMAEAGQTLLKDPATFKDVQLLIDHASHKRKDEQTRRSASSLSKHKAMQRTSDEAHEKNLFSFSYGGGGSGAYGVGAEGCFGYVFDLPDVKQFKGFYGVGGVAGYSFGASLSFQIGVWTSPPSGLAGPYLAVGVEVGDKVGGGAQVIFSMPTTEKAWQDVILSGKLPFSGIVVGAGAGQELGVSVSSGYTWVY